MLATSSKGARSPSPLAVFWVLLGLAVVGGLVFSQFITLYLTPVVYLYLAKVQTKIAGERPSARPGAGQPALAPAGD